MKRSKLRTGFTTGTCAAAAAKAATIVSEGVSAPAQVEIGLPDGSRVTLPVEASGRGSHSAWAAVRKDAGDDPDVTDGVLVKAAVSWLDQEGFVIAAGEGVGTVTKPGLALPPGEPAINPVPRRMIMDAVREVTDRGVRVAISIPGGKELADKTFNPRLGVQGGLSILGTSGVVRPFSSSALRDALKCSLSVAQACKVTAPVFVPGRIGARAAGKHFRLSPEQLVEVSNEWGFMLDQAVPYDFERLLVLGHPGKLAKLADGNWDTHSSRSRSAVGFVVSLGEKLFGQPMGERPPTVEGIFSALSEGERKFLASELARLIGEAVSERTRERFIIAVVLVNLRGEILGQHGDLETWQ
ncbi:MAG: cobalamin biosynthesis protein CbiD [Desulfomonile tiedjei]|nr:cobalamin biosynthesis protein CbiD [Desulfomonile tiedjei]